MSELGELNTQPVDEQSELNRVVETVLGEINGETIEQKLLDLAQIGGNIIEVGKEVAVTRLALSKEDMEARVLLQKQMEDAGMQVEQHPMGLISLYPGENPDLPAVVLDSHFDSVPNGGMYDGTVGVISSIEVIRLLHENGLKFPRSIRILAFTGEESSRFNIALFGSRAMFHGLTDEELDSKRPGDLSIKEALRANRFNPDDVQTPRFTKNEVYAAIELHVSQDSRLEEHGMDLAVIEAIAAPERFQIMIGDPIEPDTQEPPNAQYLRVSIKGQAGHSGATPMGLKYRADSLLGASILINGAIRRYQELRKLEGKDIDISIGNLSIPDQALNKIPGEVEFTIRVGGKDEDAIENIIQCICSYKGQDVHRGHPEFPQRSVDIRNLEKPNGEKFYKSKDIIPRQEFADDVIRVVNHRVDFFNSYDQNNYIYHTQGGNIVGTVGTYNLNDKGQMVLGIDIRDTNLRIRDTVVNDIKEVIEKLSKGVKVSYELKTLPGSGQPTLMDRRLVKLAEEKIKKYNLGSCETTFSPAGHDIQNLARLEIPTVMIFIPSRNNGASHVPEEYSTPEDLERGAKALAALVMELAAEA